MEEMVDAAVRMRRRTEHGLPAARDATFWRGMETHHDLLFRRPMPWNRLPLLGVLLRGRSGVKGILLRERDGDRRVVRRDPQLRQ